MRPGEPMEQALRRVAREELGIEFTSFEPLLFQGRRSREALSRRPARARLQIFLVFRCQTTHTEIRLNDEFEASE